MYAMGVLDARIRPFIFMVRRWAKELQLTRHNFRECLTNCQLSYMCLSFLQQLKEPVIPTFDEVMRQNGTSKSTHTGNTVIDAFSLNLDQCHFKTKNTDTVLELFQQFLDHYESYNFRKYMVTVRTTDKIPKPDPSPLYLENIFDLTKQLSDNVSLNEALTLQIMIRQTQSELKECSLKPTDKNQDWGLLEMFSTLR